MKLYWTSENEDDSNSEDLFFVADSFGVTNILTDVIKKGGNSLKSIGTGLIFTIDRVGCDCCVKVDDYFHEGEKDRETWIVDECGGSIPYALMLRDDDSAHEVYNGIHKMFEHFLNWHGLSCMVYGESITVQVINYDKSAFQGKFDGFEKMC